MIFFPLIGFLLGHNLFLIVEKKLINFIYAFFIQFLIVFGFLFLSIIIHELGHLIAGLKTGYKFLSFRFLSVVIIKYKDGFSLKRFTLPGTGGQCLLIPPPYKDGKYLYKLYNNGGWMANIFISFVGLIFYFFIRNNILNNLLLVFILINIYFALTNGIPMNLGINNDGANLKELNKSKDARRDFYLSLKINSEITLGKKYQELDEKYFIKSNTKNSFSYYIPYSQSLKYMEEGNFQEAYNELLKIYKDNSTLELVKSTLIYPLNICRIALGEDYYKNEVKRSMNKQFKSFDKLYRNQIDRIVFWILYYRYIELNKEKEIEFIRLLKKIGGKYPELGTIKSQN